MLGDHIRPNVGMASHDLPLVLAQWSWLVEYVIADSDLPEVMQGTGRSNELHLAISKLKVFSKPA
jgi:hypothetical protein